MRAAAFTKSFTAAALVDADAIKTSIATSLTAVAYSGAQLNGASASEGTATPAHGMAAYPTAALSSQTGAYTNGSTITWTGSYRGKTVTRTGTITNANGGQTVTGDGPLETCTSVTVAAQAATNGLLEFGWNDAVPPGVLTPQLPLSTNQNDLRTWLKIVATSTGNIRVGYAGGREDTVPMVAGQELNSAVTRIYASSTTANMTVHST
jgi:hypothetical protein